MSPFGPKEKASKAEADYGTGMPDEHCSLCAHFSPSRLRCRRVEGLILPAMWCKFFARRKYVRGR